MLSEFRDGQKQLSDAARRPSPAFLPVFSRLIPFSLVSFHLVASDNTYPASRLSSRSFFPRFIRAQAIAAASNPASFFPVTFCFRVIKFLSFRLAVDAGNRVDRSRIVSICQRRGVIGSRDRGITMREQIATMGRTSKSRRSAVYETDINFVG